MNPWRPYPLLRPGIAFLAGVTASLAGWFSFILPLGIPAILLTVLLLQALFPQTLTSFKTRWIQGSLIQTLVFVLGNQLADRQQDEAGRILMPEAPQRGVWVARICGQPSAGVRTVRFPADIWLADNDDTRAQPAGRLMVYLHKTSVSNVLCTGQLLLMEGVPEPFPGPLEPGGFDARAFYAGQGISHRLYASDGKWRILSLRHPFSLRAAACTIRDRLLRILIRSGLKGQEFAVAAALLLGYTRDIDRELLQDYSATGAMHVLSVSGMHAGVVFLFLETLLSFMNRKRTLVIVKALLVSASIFVYALITGLSPPVLRAAVMLSLVVAGKAMRRQPDLLNILTASLLVLVALDPQVASDTGFQFSYLAVAGILWLYKPVYDLYVTSSWLPDKIWSIIAVSLAAQIATFPLGIFRFHQFPDYFLLTNLAVVPLSSVIIYFGIFTLAAGTVPVLSGLSGHVLSLLVSLLNGIIRAIENLPGSVLRGLSISLPGMLMLYVLLCALFLYLLSKRKRYLFLFLAAVDGLVLLFLLEKVNLERRRAFTIYEPTRNCLRVKFFSGDREEVLTLSPGVTEPEKNQNSMMEQPNIVFVNGSYTMLYGMRIGFLWGKLPPGSGNRLRLDLLVIFSGATSSATGIPEWYETPLLIVGDGIPAFRAREFQELSVKQGIRVYDLRKKGAFTVSF